MRIGINIQDELLQRVKEIRPEVNVSQICREALEEYARNAKRVAEQVAADGMEEHTLRFAESDSAPLIEPDWAGMALEDARDWVRAADPDLWFDFWRDYDEYQEEGRDFSRTIDFWIGRARVKGFTFDRTDENREWFHRLLSRRTTLTSGRKFRDDYDRLHKKAEDEYYRTWLGYVLEARRMLKQHLDVEYKKKMAERKREFLARLRGELPPLMLEYYEV